MKALTEQQSIWCEKVAVNMAATDPVPLRDITMECFVSVKAKDADQKTATLMNSPQIIQRLSQLCARIHAEDEYGPSEIVTDLNRIARSNILDYVSWDQKGVVTFRPSAELDRAKAANIIGVKRIIGRAGSSLEIKFADKMKAYDSLMAYHGMLKPDTDDPADAGELKDLTDDDLTQEAAKILADNPELLRQLVGAVTGQPAATNPG